MAAMIPIGIGVFSQLGFQRARSGNILDRHVLFIASVLSVSHLAFNM